MAQGAPPDNGGIEGGTNHGENGVVIFLFLLYDDLVRLLSSP